MPLFITVIMLVVIAAVLFFFKTVRDIVVDFFQGCGLYVAGAWARRPTLAEIWAAIRLPVFVLLIGWGALIFILTGIGFYVKAPFAGFLIALLLPIWFVLRLLRGLPSFVGKFFRFIFATTWWITTVVLVIALAYFLVGVWSPEYKASGDRYYANKKLEWANTLDKKSVQSEPESGIFAFVKETTSVYNDKDVVILTLREGERVMVISLEGKKEENKEGMTLIRASDERGDFVTAGKIGWVPSRKLEWKKAKDEQVKDSSTSATPANINSSSDAVLGNIPQVYVLLSKGDATPNLVAPSCYKVYVNVDNVGEAGFTFRYKDGTEYHIKGGQHPNLPDKDDPFKVVAGGPNQKVVVSIVKKG